MRSLYLEYLKERAKEETSTSTVGEVVEAIRTLVVGEKEKAAKPNWLMKKRFQRFRRSYKELGEDPSCA